MMTNYRTTASRRASSRSCPTSPTRRSSRRSSYALGARLGGQRRVHRRSASAQHLLGDVRQPDVRPEGPGRHPDGDQRLPEDLSEPLHPRDGVRRDARLGDAAHVVHRQPAGARARASGWRGRRSTGAPSATPSSATPPRARRRALRRERDRRAPPRRPASAGEPPAAVDLAAVFARRGRRRRCSSSSTASWSGLAPVKTRIREIAALLLVERARSAARADRGRAVAAHVLHRQSGHRQDHRGAAHGGDPASAGLRAQGPSRRRHARRSGRPVHRPHRAEDQGGPEEGDGRRAVHRRGVLPVPARERARLRPGGDRDPAAGDGEPARRPGRDPRRLQGPDGHVLPLQSRACRRASRTTSTFPTTAERRAARDRRTDAGRACSTASATTARAALARVHRAAAHAAALRQRALDPQRARPRAAAAGQPPVRARAAARRPRRR